MPVAREAAPPSREVLAGSLEAYPAHAPDAFYRLVEDPTRWALTRDGKLVEREGAADEDLPALDPDPRWFGLRLRSLPGLHEVFAWMEDGGRIDQLDPAQRARLADLDGLLVADGGLGPFRPFLEAAPSDEWVVEDARWGKMKVGGRRFRGWAATAARAYAEALALAEELQEQLGEDPGGVLGVELPEEAGLMAFLDPLAVLIPLLGDPALRTRVAQWLRPGVVPLRRAIYAAGRALEEDPDQREDLAVFFARASTYANLLFVSELVDLDPAQLLGRAPERPADWAFAGDNVRKGLIFQDSMGGVPAARRASIPALWGQAMAVDPETQGTAEADKRFRRALGRLARFYTRYKDHTGLRELIDHFRPAMVEDPGQVGREGLVELASYMGENPDPEMLVPEYAGSVLVAARAYLAAHPGDDGDGKLERAAGKLADLIGG